MSCRKLTKAEYDSLVASNPVRIPYDDQATCEERSCCDTGGCCRETLVLDRCRYNMGDCSPSTFGLGPEWQNVAGSPWWCQMVRQRPKVNGGCVKADFPTFVTCGQYQQVCEPQSCYTDCVRYGEVCPDPNDPNSCYQDCLEYGDVCPPDYCYDECVSYEGVDILPCSVDDMVYPRGISQWYVSEGGGCCSSGECPRYYGDCP